MRKTRLLIAGCAICLAAAGQSQVNQSPLPKPPNVLAPLAKPARIEGTLVDDLYLRPLKRGYIVLKPTGAGRALSGETDEAGRFTIENVDPGAYTIEARRDGYISANWGRRGGIRMPRIFSLFAGQEMRDLTFRLEPWGVIEGRIRFDDGEAAFGVPVILYRKHYYRGRLMYQQSGSTRTNDRGEYRVPGLAPGAYIIAAIYNKPVKPKNPDSEPGEIPASEWSYATTYFTSGRSLADAIPVKLESGRELSGLDIYLGLVRAIRVKMLVNDSCAGELSSKAVVQLYRMDENGNPVVPVNAEIEGRGGVFTIRGLGPGQYLVTSSSDGRLNCEGPLRDRRIISVADYPIDDLILNLGPPVAANFSLSTDGPGFNGSNFSQFAFHLEPRSGLPGGSIQLERQRSGVYQYLAQLDKQEEYDVIMDRAPANAYLKGPLSVNGSARILVGTKGATLTGSVADDNRVAIPGATVTLIPDPAKDRFQRYAETYTNELGSFGVSGLGPGKYIAVPWLDVPPCDFYNFESLDACRPFGSTVDLSDSESKGLALVLKTNN